MVIANFGADCHESVAFGSQQGTAMGITQPPPLDGAWSALFSNLSKSALENYVVKRSERPLLEEVA